MIREKNIESDAKLTSKNTKLGSIIEIDPQCLNKIKIKDQNTLVICTYDKYTNEEVIIGGKIVSLYDENFISIKYI